jgi:hypothetical protein
MSQLTDQYLAETGKNAIVQKYKCVYYTAYYVNWLEKLIEGVRERAPNKPSAAQSLNREYTTSHLVERCLQ